MVDPRRRARAPGMRRRRLGQPSHLVAIRPQPYARRRRRGHQRARRAVAPSSPTCCSTPSASPACSCCSPRCSGGWSSCSPSASAPTARRPASFPLAVLLLAGGFAALPLSAGWPFGHSFGGIVGDWAYKLTATVFDLVGAESAMPLAGLALLPRRLCPARLQRRPRARRPQPSHRAQPAHVAPPRRPGSRMARAVLRPCRGSLRNRPPGLHQKPPRSALATPPTTTPAMARAASPSSRVPPRSSVPTTSFKRPLRRPSPPARVAPPQQPLTTRFPAAAMPTSTTAPMRKAAPSPAASRRPTSSGPPISSRKSSRCRARSARRPRRRRRSAAAACSPASRK